MATYVEIGWVGATSLERVFGVQAGITAGAGLLVLFLGLYGKRVRSAQGGMSFRGGHEVRD